MNFNDFNTRGQGISEHSLMVNNRCSDELFKYSKRTGNIVDVTENAVNGILGIVKADDVFKAKGIPEMIAKTIQSDINANGGTLSADYHKNHQKLLSTVYLMLGLCYVSVGKRDSNERVSFLASKNDIILNCMLDNCDKKGVSDDKLKKLRDKRIITDDELANSYLSVIKFSHNGVNDKYKLGTARIYPNSDKTIVLPYVAAKMRAQRILDMLCKNRCRIEYISDNKTDTVYTTIANKTQYMDVVNSLKHDICTLPIIDFRNGRHIVLNTLDIRSIFIMR